MMSCARYMLVLFCALSVAACASSGAAPSTIRQQQTSNGLSITLERATEPKLNQTQAFTIRLTDSTQAPVEGADIYLDLTMPADPMGTNRPIATPQGAGVYTAQSAFIMVGDWAITVVANVNGTEHRVVFDATVTQ
jgi:nitrogen fixation protein FixH